MTTKPIISISFDLVGKLADHEILVADRFATTVSNSLAPHFDVCRAICFDRQGLSRCQPQTRIDAFAIVHWFPNPRNTIEFNFLSCRRGIYNPNLPLPVFFLEFRGMNYEGIKIVDETNQVEVERIAIGSPLPNIVAQSIIDAFKSRSVSVAG